MQKILQFTREEVVTRLESAAVQLLDYNLESLDLVAAVELVTETRKLIDDILYFDVFINKGLFHDLSASLDVLSTTVSQIQSEFDRQVSLINSVRHAFKLD